MIPERLSRSNPRARPKEDHSHAATAHERVLDILETQHQHRAAREHAGQAFEWTDTMRVKR
jgi:hypothetical protein